MNLQKETLDKALYVHYKEEFKYKTTPQTIGQHLVKLKDGIKKINANTYWVYPINIK